EQEIIVRIERLYDFKGDVQLKTSLPAGIQGIAVQDTKIPGNEGEVRLKAKIGPEAPAGEHTATLSARVNLNGENIDLTQTFTLKIRAKDENKT
ncbi:MAG: hypothetical protein AAF492_09170, partial [Verrucomicrobiota bacterium]